MKDPKRIRIAGIVGKICGIIFCAIHVYRG